MKKKDIRIAVVALVLFLLGLLLGGTDDLSNAKEVQKLELARKN